MSNFAVVHRDRLVACRHPEGTSWHPAAEAWRMLDLVLTWETENGAQLFAEMNGGTVTPFAEVFDQTVILPTSEPQTTGVQDHDEPESPRPLRPNDCMGCCPCRQSGHDEQQVERDLMRTLEPSSWLVMVWLAVILLLSLTALGGCAALPMPLQPQTEENSNMAEGTFLVLATVDTVQTMHIRQGTSCDHEGDPIAAALYGSQHPKPGRVLATNLVLMTVHTMLASWLDDKVAEHKALNDGSVGPWYVGRMAFHGVSILAEGSAVASNASRGCKF